MKNFQYTDDGLALTKKFEGLRLTAYQDGAGVWTIGYGHTGPDVHPGKVINEAEAEQLLLQDMALAVACVNQHVTSDINQNMFNALADFTFNAGRGSFLSSHLLIYTNEGNFTEAADQFGLWVHAGGEVEPGLVARRKAEADLYLTPVA